MSNQYNKMSNQYNKMSNEYTKMSETHPRPLDYLAQQQPHERDANILFDAGPHIYTIKGHAHTPFTSVTTWNHSHFAHFDAEAIITKMMQGKGWPTSKYFGQTSDEIKAGWEINRTEAAAAGTNLHYQIEYYYNTGQTTGDTTSPEYTYFKNFLAVSPKPYRTEWMIYHEELRLAGSIDMVFENPDGTLMIYDWKRAKEIKKADGFAKYAHTACISHIPDTNFWHYTLQLNTYKAILEEKYGKTVTKLALVCLHPAKTNFQVIPVPVLAAEMAALFALRREQINI